MKSGNALLGVLAGIATGALLGVMFAPDKGTKTRKKIVQKSTDYSDELRSRIDNLITSISGRISSAKSGAMDMVESVRAEANDMLESGKSKVKELVENGKSHVEEAKKEVRDFKDSAKEKMAPQT